MGLRQERLLVSSPGKLEELLRQKYEITDSIFRRKPTASVSATMQDIDELAASCHAVVVGLGD